MNIWIDFINSPQVSFFEPLINDLKSEGHEFVLTCRDSANTVELIKQRNWKYIIIGTKAEKGTLRKTCSFPLRIKLLHNYLKGKKIDAAICQSSFYLPLTSRLLNIPSIYTNDNEHALGNIPAFLFASKIFIPENLSLAQVVKRGGRKSKITQYPGIKEGIYLWMKGIDIYNKRRSNVLKKDIFIRPEPLTAQYYTGKFNFLDTLIIELQAKYSVTVLVRDRAQLLYYTQPKFTGISVPEKPLTFEDVAVACKLFIGAGGSMTREMAIMGIPTISVYQGELLEVDKFLIAKKLMVYQPDLQFDGVVQIIQSSADKKVNMEVIEKGKTAYKLFKTELLKYNK